MQKQFVHRQYRIFLVSEFYMEKVEAAFGEHETCHYYFVLGFVEFSVALVGAKVYDHFAEAV